ncbi:MAG: alpha/beta fold hydrolase [Candidatus Rokubacteria bacterium]|nr:alpha/beta fold hydrolase [Candidatus Rokubacteria bacterium]
MVRVNDIDLYYEESGAGDPLVLIMGLSGDHLAWGFQVPAFAERYRVIAFDNRGVGQSGQPDIEYTIPRMAEDTRVLMDALGIERAHVLGVSMGGMIAQELTLRHPTRVRTLQIHCSMARPDGHMRALLEAWRTIRAALPPEPAMRTVATYLFAPTTYDERPEFVELVIQSGLANPYPQSLTGFLRQCGAVATHDTLDRLGAIRCPALVSVGEEDILVPARFSRHVAEKIPHAEFETIANAGHVYFWEKPDEFNRMCLDFLERNGKT